MTRSRLLFIQPATLEQVLKLAQSGDWKLQGRLEDPSLGSDWSHPLESEWSVPPHFIRLHWIRDQELDCQYLVLVGNGQENLIQELGRTFELASLPELLTRIDGDEKEQFDAARGVAVLSFEPADSESRQAFSRLLASPNPKVRHFTLLAQDYRPDRGLLPQFEAMKNDSDPTVRQRAIQVFDSFLF